ncbi:hypothetical protein [Peribacillus sp. SCS-155]|uniref:hypothetical protein n=1 Tax=Peribacillus sedimenti TaxID=3115297 RepID=UPI00390686B5
MIDHKADNHLPGANPTGIFVYDHNGNQKLYKWNKTSEILQMQQGFKNKLISQNGRLHLLDKELIQYKKKQAELQVELDSQLSSLKHADRQITDQGQHQKALEQRLNQFESLQLDHTKRLTNGEAKYGDLYSLLSNYETERKLLASVVSQIQVSLIGMEQKIEQGDVKQQELAASLSQLQQSIQHMEVKLQESQASFSLLSSQFAGMIGNIEAFRTALEEHDKMHSGFSQPIRQY